MPNRSSKGMLGEYALVVEPHPECPDKWRVTVKMPDSRQSASFQSPIDTQEQAKAFAAESAREKAEEIGASIPEDIAPTWEGA